MRVIQFSIFLLGLLPLERKKETWLSLHGSFASARQSRRGVFFLGSPPDPPGFEGRIQYRVVVASGSMVPDFFYPARENHGNTQGEKRWGLVLSFLSINTPAMPIQLIKLTHSNFSLSEVTVRPPPTISFCSPVLSSSSC